MVGNNKHPRQGHPPRDALAEGDLTTAPRCGSPRGESPRWDSRKRGDQPKRGTIDGQDDPRVSVKEEAHRNFQVGSASPRGARTSSARRSCWPRKNNPSGTATPLAVVQISSIRQLSSSATRPVLLDTQGTGSIDLYRSELLTPVRSPAKRGSVTAGSPHKLVPWLEDFRLFLTIHAGIGETSRPTPDAGRPRQTSSLRTATSRIRISATYDEGDKPPVPDQRTPRVGLRPRGRLPVLGRQNLFQRFRVIERSTAADPGMFGLQTNISSATSARPTRNRPIAISEEKKILRRRHQLHPRLRAAQLSPTMRIASSREPTRPSIDFRGRKPRSDQPTGRSSSHPRGGRASAAGVLRRGQRLSEREKLLPELPAGGNCRWACSTASAWAFPLRSRPSRPLRFFRRCGVR